MTKISFNAQAFRIAFYYKGSDMRHAEIHTARISVMRTDTGIQPLSKRLSFANV